MWVRRFCGAVLVVAALAGCARNSVEPAVTGSAGGSAKATKVAGSGGGSGKPAKAAGRSGVPAFDHVVVVVFENKAVSQVLGRAPYFSSLAARGANLTNFFAETHP